MLSSDFKTKNLLEMIIKILKFSSVLFIGSVLFTSCTKKFDQINTDPSTYSQSNFDPNYLLTSAELRYAGPSGALAIGSNFLYSSVMMQGLSSVLLYWVGDKYLLTEQYTANYWQDAYVSQVKPVVDLVQFTKDKPQYKNLYQIARIMKALIMERLTDLYGDIPYAGAGMGYYSNNYFPFYDKQQEIYADLLKEVEEATLALDDGADKPAGDAIYGGNIAQWKKFGNTLLLRIALRLTKIDPALAQSYVTKVQGKTMESNADNAYMTQDASGAPTTDNANSRVLLGDGGTDQYYTKWSQTFINFLKTTDDPRLEKIAVTRLYLNPNSKIQNPTYNSDPMVQKGMPNGKDLLGIPAQAISSDPSFTTLPDYSSPNPYMLKRNAPTFLLTYAQSELLLADAAQRWGVGGSPATHYNNGVKAAMTVLVQYDPALAVSDADADAYLSAHPYDATKGLEMINSQYWVHTITTFDFYETWSNWRRTGLPVLNPVIYPNSATGGVIPRRFPYPLTESSNNPVNYKTASDAVSGGDHLIGRVWWDKQ
jgi:hypothetical protein